MNILIVSIIILFISSIGYVVIRMSNLLSEKDTLLALGVSYGLGVGLVGGQLYLYSRIDIPWSKELLIAPWLVLFLVFFIKVRNKLSFAMPRISQINVVERVLLLGILFTFCYVIFEALLRPVVAWDAWANWLLQAKVFFIEGKIYPKSLDYMDSQYPLTINLLNTFVYIILGKVDDTAVLLTSTGFYAFLGISFFAVLKRKYGMRYAMLFTFLLLTTQNFVRHGGRLEAGLADMPLGYYTFCGVVFLFEYMKKNSKKLFILLSIFLGITALIKFEGVTLSLLIGLWGIDHLIRKRQYSHVKLLLFWILPYILWKIDRRMMHLEAKYLSGHHFETSLRKTIDAFIGTCKELINIKSWNMLWIAYFYSFFFLKIKDKELVILNTIIVVQLVIYMLTYLFTAGHTPESSIERLLMHIAPLAFYYMAKVVNDNRKFMLELFK